MPPGRPGNSRPPAQPARSPDIQRVWLCGALWASLTLGGGRSRSCNFDPKRRVGIGRGRSYGAVMHFPGAGKNVLSYACMRNTSFVSLRAPRSEMSAERSSEGGFEGIENIFAAVGLSGAAQPQPARRGMLSRDLFESPSGPPSRRSSVANGHGNGREVIARRRRLLFTRSRWQRATRMHHLRISRIHFLALVHETVASKSRSLSRLLPPYRKRVQEVIMTMR